MSADFYRRVRTVRSQTEGVVGRGQRFIDVIIKKGVLIVENRSRKDGVINCQDRAVAWHVYVASNVGMPPNQEISGPSEAEVTVDK